MTQSLRRVTLAERCRARGLDALLVSDLHNVRYLAGFTGSNAALLVYADDRPAILATDGRYRTQAATQAPDLETVITRALGVDLACRAAADGVPAGTSLAAQAVSSSAAERPRAAVRRIFIRGVTFRNVWGVGP